VDGAAAGHHLKRALQDAAGSDRTRRRDWPRPDPRARGRASRRRRPSRREAAERDARGGRRIVLMDFAPACSPRSGLAVGLVARSSTWRRAVRSASGHAGHRSVSVGVLLFHLVTGIASVRVDHDRDPRGAPAARPAPGCAICGPISRRVRAGSLNGRSPPGARDRYTSAGDWKATQPVRRQRAARAGRLGAA